MLVTECHVAEAHGHAARNDARSCSKALTSAEHAFVAGVGSCNAPEWLSYFDEAYLSARIAQCFRDLGDGSQTVRYAQRSLDMNGDFVRGRAFNLALLGTGLPQQREIDHATSVGIKAAGIAMSLQSQRSVGYVVNLQKKLAAVAPPQVIQEFTHQTRILVRERTAKQ